MATLTTVTSSIDGPIEYEVRSQVSSQSTETSQKQQETGPKTTLDTRLQHMHKVCSGDYTRERTEEKIGNKLPNMQF